MRTIEDVVSLREIVREARRADRSVGLVPTMGSLHEGHLRLVDEARAANDLVVMSVFVNPTQFGPYEDFARYPRDLEQDALLAGDRGVDILFVPTVQAMYPDGPERQEVWVEPRRLAESLDGASRPGHFRGVATVVAKLFNMVAPDRAYFGQKDAQQARILSRMAFDLGFPIEVVVVPTVREKDGLALSSRNVYLSPSERSEAVALWRALQEARARIEAGERNASTLERAMTALVAEEAPSGRLDFAQVVDLDGLRPFAGSLTRDSLIALAVFFGSTRLIDNLIVTFVDEVPRFS